MRRRSPLEQQIREGYEMQMSSPFVRRGRDVKDHGETISCSQNRWSEPALMFVRRGSNKVQGCLRTDYLIAGALRQKGGQKVGKRGPNGLRVGVETGTNGVYVGVPPSKHSRRK